MCIFTSTPYLEFLENQSEFLIIKILYIHFYLFYMSSEAIFILSWSLFLLFNPNVSLLSDPSFRFKAFCWWFFIRFPISSCVNIIDFISLMGHQGHALYLSIDQREEKKRDPKSQEEIDNIFYWLTHHLKLQKKLETNTCIHIIVLTVTQDF